MSYICVAEHSVNGVYCVIVHAICDTCKGVTMLTIPESQWLCFTGGELIQNALTSVSDVDRELLISGTCGKCWKELFADDEGDAA